MDKFLRFLFSMKMMSLGLLIFLFAIGTATILESMYDTQTAKVVIYNAIWFEVLLAYLGFNLIANIFRYRMWMREKIAMLMFHLSFIVILVGAALTRYAGFEGIMRLPEPDPMTGTLRPVDFIYSSDPRLKIFIEDKYIETTMFMSEITDNYFDVTFDFPEKKKSIKVEYVDFQSKHIDSLIVNDTITDFVLDIVTGGMNSSYLEKGKFLKVGSIPLSFECEDKLPDGVELVRKDGQMLMKTTLPMRYLPMSEMQAARQSGVEVADSMYVEIPLDTLVPFRTTTLYQIGEEQFVFKQLINHAKMMRMPSGRKDVGRDYLTLKITDGDQSREVVLEGGIGTFAAEERFDFNGMLYSMQYGSIPISLPFSVACNDFRMETYPGSMTPSSYESTLTFMDPRKSENFTKDIKMNHFIDYDGYRFFQSSYFEDQRGTVLSVNSDWWGTNITYLGYLMMAIGMIMSLFAPIGRFRELNSKLKKLSEKRAKMGASIVAALIALNGFGQQVADTGHVHDHDHTHDHAAHVHNHDHDPQAASAQELGEPGEVLMMSAEHAEQLSYLLVQDFDGRIVPLHTVCDELMRKIHRGNTYTYKGKKYNAVQTIIGIHLASAPWTKEKFIYVSGVLRDKLGIDGAYASLEDLVDENNNFKLEEDYRIAHRKLDKNKSEYDKQLIKLVERSEIFIGFLRLEWNYLRICPVRADEKRTWYPPISEAVIQNEDSLFKTSMAYFANLYSAMDNGDYSLADQSLEKLKRQQREIAGSLAPNQFKVDLEVSYNKMSIFKYSEYTYALLGFILLIIYFVRIFTHFRRKESKGLRLFTRIFSILVGVVFVYHGAGLAMRWYISGHAPWSNGYEAIVFIAWITILAGSIFSRKNPVILAAAGILAFFMLFVTELNILDPEITTLQPVLKSYWLMIHVAIITSSYGFLGLGAILGFVNLVLYTFRNKRNGEYVTLNISEITYVSEMTMTIGLFLLTIGTFLGGIWANESWGRYWGWDPKETWALVSVLVYAILLHLRFIPALKSKFTFNVYSLWGFSAILFTFFGVNFYLVGLHSYAQGDGLGKFPDGVIIATIIFYVFTEFAALQNRRYRKPASEIGATYFGKKTVILIGAFVAAYVLFGLFKVAQWNEVLFLTGCTAAIVAGTNVLLFIIQRLRGEVKQADH